MPYTFDELQEMSRAVAREFDRVERRPWGVEPMVIELAKQIGDLAKRVMVVERYYLADRDDAQEYATGVTDIADELADILHGIIRVADLYEIDLERAHIDARRRECRYLGMVPQF